VSDAIQLITFICAILEKKEEDIHLANLVINVNIFNTYLFLNDLETSEILRSVVLSFY